MQRIRVELRFDEIIASPKFERVGGDRFAALRGHKDRRHLRMTGRDRGYQAKPVGVGQSILGEHDVGRLAGQDLERLSGRLGHSRRCGGAETLLDHSQPMVDFVQPVVDP